MTSDVDLQQLIQRMSDKTPTNASSDSISWKAHREAEKLDDLSLLPLLVHILSDTKNKEHRKQIYFILGHIGRNTKDKTVTQILLNQLPHENDKYVLSTLLEALEKQPSIDDCSPLLPYINDSRWLVRHSAILVLGSCQTATMAEQTLLKILSTTEDTFDQGYALAALYGVGTENSLTQLSEMFDKFTGERRAQCLELLSKLGDSSFLHLFTNALKDRSAFVRWSAMGAILRHGNEDAILSVIERVKSILARPRKVGQLPKSDLIQGLEFLYQYLDKDESLNKLFDWINDKKMNFFFDEEREQFQRLNWKRSNMTIT